MELDTGAAALVSEETHSQHWPQQQLEELDIRLKTYLYKYLETRGTMNVNVCYGINK